MVGAMTSSIGTRIAEERKRIGLTQKALARMLNPNVQSGVTVSKWERGKTRPEALALGKLAEAGVDIDYVLTGQHTLLTD